MSEDVVLSVVRLSTGLRGDKGIGNYRVTLGGWVSIVRFDLPPDWWAYMADRRPTPKLVFGFQRRYAIALLTLTSKLRGAEWLYCVALLRV